MSIFLNLDGQMGMDRLAFDGEAGVNLHSLDTTRRGRKHFVTTIHPR
jgi:hypothetical protein